MKDLIDLISRVLISLLFLLNGYFKIINYDGTIEWMESYGVPGIFLTPAIILEIAAPILIIIGYNTKKIIKNKGSAIFIHVTHNYKHTRGCIALSLNDLEILLKIIKRNSKIKIS